MKMTHYHNDGNLPALETLRLFLQMYKGTCAFYYVSIRKKNDQVVECRLFTRTVATQINFLIGWLCSMLLQNAS